MKKTLIAAALFTLVSCMPDHVSQAKVMCDSGFKTGWVSRAHADDGGIKYSGGFYKPNLGENCKIKWRKVKRKG